MREIRSSGSGEGSVPLLDYFWESTPVVVSSPDRSEVSLVPHWKADGKLVMVGPLAQRFHEVWRNAVARQKPLTHRQFVEGLTHAEDGGPSGYAAWLPGQVALTDDAVFEVIP